MPTRRSFLAGVCGLALSLTSLAATSSLRAAPTELHDGPLVWRVRSRRPAEGFVRAVFFAQASFNAHPFRGFPAGSLQLVGVHCTYDYRADEWAFEFLAKHNPGGDRFVIVNEASGVTHYLQAFRRADFAALTQSAAAQT